MIYWDISFGLYKYTSVLSIPFRSSNSDTFWLNSICRYSFISYNTLTHSPLLFILFCSIYNAEHGISAYVINNVWTRHSTILDEYPQHTHTVETSRTNVIPKTFRLFEVWNGCTKRSILCVESFWVLFFAYKNNNIINSNDTITLWVKW